jgi:hypothetical protein
MGFVPGRLPSGYHYAGWTNCRKRPRGAFLSGSGDDAVRRATQPLYAATTANAHIPPPGDPGLGQCSGMTR